MTIKEVSETFDISADTLRYYERIGMIPEVTRTAGGIRDYQESDLGWVELVICMRKAGLPVEALIEYVKLYQEGDETFEARLQLLSEEREKLEEQKAQIESILQGAEQTRTYLGKIRAEVQTPLRYKRNAEQ